ncbi:hypothetical protein QVD17_41495 [Tagetes erecta]|uniref:Uncharacterized protein n=1 Tax=Tagetes erecta TaxID=13708 RepID=A0AAD8JM84_TARER|nr:hypothetical protein QVD17_41495 [Tagetes erecta]
METERKRGGENVEVVEKRLKKRKPYAKEKDYLFDREVDEIQAEVDAGRENRTKRKSDVRSEAAKKAKHDIPGTSTESVSELKGEIESLKAKLVDLKSKGCDLNSVEISMQVKNLDNHYYMYRELVFLAAHTLSGKIVVAYAFVLAS